MPEDFEQQIEAEIKQKGLTAPRIKKEQIDALVQSLEFKTHRFAGTTSTVAIAVLPNGFVAGVGHSAAVSPENFNAALGESIAINNAINIARDKLWELEGYSLRKSLDK